MLCRHCKKTIDDDSSYCKYCGMPVSAKVRDFVKKFHFGDYTRNKANIKEINTWLKSQSIRIVDCNIDTFVNEAVINSELVIKDCEIIYHVVDTESHYHMSGFTSYTWNPRSKNDFSKLERKVESWELDNPGTDVVWVKFVEQENEAENHVNQSVYFMFLEDEPF